MSGWDFLGSPKQNDDSLYSKWTISYYCSSHVHLTWYQSHALNLDMSIKSSNVEQRTSKDKRVEPRWRGDVEPRLKWGVGWKSDLLGYFSRSDIDGGKNIFDFFKGWKILIISFSLKVFLKILIIYI